MISLKVLLQLTPFDVATRGRSCTSRILFNGVRASKDGEQYYEVISRAKSAKSTNSYVTTIQFHKYGKIKTPLNHPTWVRCSCPYFLYYVEVALTRHDSSDIYYSNGRYPMIRNPKLRPYLCKHLSASLRPAIKVLYRDMQKPQKESLVQKIPNFVKRLLTRKKPPTIT